MRVCVCACVCTCVCVCVFVQGWFDLDTRGGSWWATASKTQLDIDENISLAHKECGDKTVEFTSSLHLARKPHKQQVHALLSIFVPPDRGALRSIRHLDSSLAHMSPAKPLSSPPLPAIELRQRGVVQEVPEETEDSQWKALCALLPVFVLSLCLALTQACAHTRTCKCTCTRTRTQR